METIRLRSDAGQEVIINKPKKKALAELAKAEQEERTPVLPEQDREDAVNYLAWLAKSYRDPSATPEKTGKKDKKTAEPEAPASEEGK
jgi:hypothetical protein